MAHPPPGDPQDDGTFDGDFTALDFGVAPEDDGAETDLGLILGDYPDATAEADITTDDPLAAFTSPGDQAEEAEGAAAPMFTVANPPGTVTVTTFLDGRVHRVDLAPETTTMAESALADEIVVIAALATQDARSAQYTVMLDGMREHGHDNAATRDFLNRDLDLPTPEQAAAARLELFTNRYSGEQ